MYPRVCKDAHFAYVQPTGLYASRLSIWFPSWI
jgi:hypothetical protein